MLLYIKRTSHVTQWSHNRVAKCMPRFGKKQSLRWRVLSRNCIHTFWTGNYPLQWKTQTDTQTHPPAPHLFFSYEMQTPVAVQYGNKHTENWG